MSLTLEAEPELFSASWTALGCRAELLVVDPDELASARTAVEDVLTEVDRTLSRFRTDSELSMLNRSADPDIAVSPLLARAIRVATDAADWTGGMVDPTIGQHLLDLGYDRTFSAVPSSGPGLIAVPRQVTTFRSLTLIEPGGGKRATLHRPAGVQLDLGATGKGLAADLAADAAIDAGARSVLVNLGGDISVAGETPEGGWPVLVTDRAAPATAHEPPTEAAAPEAGGSGGQTVALRDGALATSGTSRRRWRRGGAEMHHIVDPRTGLSAVSPWRTVSVAAPTCVLANAAATASIVRGANAVAWLSATGLPARLVATDGDVVQLGGWPA